MYKALEFVTTGTSTICLTVNVISTSASLAVVITVSPSVNSKRSLIEALLSSNSTIATGTFTASGGVIQTVTLTAGGAGYSAAPVITAATGSGLSVEVSMGEGISTFPHTGWNKRTVGTGGRAGRVFWETLVAGSMADGAGDEDIATPDA